MFTGRKTDLNSQQLGTIKQAWYLKNIAFFKDGEVFM